MDLLLKDTVSETYTNASGYQLLVVLKQYLKDEDTLNLSFKDSSITSSSFLNSSIGVLVEELGVESVMRRIHPKDMSPTQATLLRKYMASFRKERP